MARLNKCNGDDFDDDSCFMKENVSEEQANILVKAFAKVSKYGVKTARKDIKQILPKTWNAEEWWGFSLGII